MLHNSWAYSFLSHKKTHSSGKEIEYLDARLDIKIMHGLFVEKYPQVNVNYKYYLKFFQENVSIRFGRPQVDTCITCEQLNVKIKSPSLADNVKTRSYICARWLYQNGEWMLWKVQSYQVSDDSSLRL